MLDKSMIKNLLVSHPSFTHNEDLRQICSPLSTFGIDYFSHVRITADQRLSFNALRPDFLEHYIKMGYYQFDLHNKDAANSEQMIVWDNVTLAGQSKLLHSDFMGHGQGHTFSIFISNKNYREVYHFAVPVGNAHINAFYLENVDLLKSFIAHFTEKVNMHKSLLKAYDPELSLLQSPGGYLTIDSEIVTDRDGFKGLLEIKRFYINGSDILSDTA